MATDRYTRTLEQRIWSRVLRTDGCWLWLGATNASGHGIIKVAGRSVLVHRLVWELYIGVPKDKVLHTCDVPNCVRYTGRDHLYEGSQAQNIQDVWDRQRRVNPNQKGEANYNAKLTYAKAELIRRVYAEGCVTQRWIARRLGIAQTTVSQIIRGDTWPS